MFGHGLSGAGSFVLGGKPLRKRDRSREVAWAAPAGGCWKRVGMAAVFVEGGGLARR